MYLYSAGTSSQPIWLNNVTCTSSSTNCLAYCESCPSFQYHNCNHSKDVSLECGKYKQTIGIETFLLFTEFSLPRSSGPYTTLATCIPGQYPGDYNICNNYVVNYKMILLLSFLK